MDGWQADEEEREAEKYPREREDVDRGLEAEQGVPHNRRRQEDGTQHVQLKITLPVLTGKESDLETGSTQHLKRPSMKVMGLPKT